ncbi:MAG: hypothetical protein WDM87_13065 [Terracidiphilus sp.]
MWIGDLEYRDSSSRVSWFNRMIRLSIQWLMFYVKVVDIATSNMKPALQMDAPIPSVILISSPPIFTRLPTVGLIFAIHSPAACGPNPSNPLFINVVQSVSLEPSDMWADDLDICLEWFSRMNQE